MGSPASGTQGTWPRQCRQMGSMGTQAQIDSSVGLKAARPCPVHRLLRVPARRFSRWQDAGTVGADFDTKQSVDLITVRRDPSIHTCADPRDARPVHYWCKPARCGHGECNSTHSRIATQQLTVRRQDVDLVHERRVRQIAVRHTRSDRSFVVQIKR